jgi:FtsZ-binding cell division protein ZapB
MEAVSAAHEAALQERETAIEKSLAKLEEELEDRKILEETVDTLQEDKAAAQRQFDDERETTTRLVSENENFQETVQALGSERNALLETMKYLETEKEDFNVKYESFQAEQVRSAFELEQSNEELVKEREDDKERLQDLHGKMEFLASWMLETQEEKNQALKK